MTSQYSPNCRTASMNWAKSTTSFSLAMLFFQSPQCRGFVVGIVFASTMILSDIAASSFDYNVK